MSVVIIGGGIAGFSLAWALQRRGEKAVTLIERELLPFSHASGRNAAIFRPVEASLVVTELAARTRGLMDLLAPGLVAETGLLLTATDPASLEGLLTNARTTATAHRLVSEPNRLPPAAPLLQGGSARCGLLLPKGGVIDIHRLTDTLRRETLDAGLKLHVGKEVIRWERRGGLVATLSSGETLHADRVVLAGGAWGAALGELGALSMPLVPHRRHLALIEPRTAFEKTHPVCWNVENDVYFRPESDGILACVGDHEPHAPGTPSVDSAELEALAERLPRESPALGNASIRRAWACLRTMTPDRHMILGADPRCGGVYWFAGLGGHGMTAGLAAADLLATHMLSGASVPPELDAARWLADGLGLRDRNNGPETRRASPRAD